METLPLAKQEEIGSKLCFRSIDEKIRKRLWVRTRRCVLKSIGSFFVREIDHSSNISMN